MCPFLPSTPSLHQSQPTTVPPLCCSAAIDCSHDSQRSAFPSAVPRPTGASSGKVEGAQLCCVYPGREPEAWPPPPACCSRSLGLPFFSSSSCCHSPPSCRSSASLFVIQQIHFSFLCSPLLVPASLFIHSCQRQAELLRPSCFSFLSFLTTAGEDER